MRKRRGRENPFCTSWRWSSQRAWHDTHCLPLAEESQPENLFFAELELVT